MPKGTTIISSQIIGRVNYIISNNILGIYPVLQNNIGGEKKKIMAFGQDRQMFDVDLSCAKCGTHISQLPFQPSGDRPVYCSDCNRQYRQTNTRDNNGGGYNRGGARPPRQMYQVNLTCADCGTAITELPFQPTGDKPVYCKNCMMARRGN